LALAQAERLVWEFAVLNRPSQSGAGLDLDASDRPPGLPSAIAQNCTPLSETVFSDLASKPRSGFCASKSLGRSRPRLVLTALAGLLAVAAAYELSGNEVSSAPGPSSSRQAVPAAPSSHAAPPALNVRPYAPDIRVGLGTDLRNTGAPAPSRGSAAARRNGVAFFAATASCIASANGRV